MIIFSLLVVVLGLLLTIRGIVGFIKLKTRYTKCEGVVIRSEKLTSNPGHHRNIIKYDYNGVSEHTAEFGISLKVKRRNIGSKVSFYVHKKDPKRVDFNTPIGYLADMSIGIMLLALGVSPFISFGPPPAI